VVLGNHGFANSVARFRISRRLDLFLRCPRIPPVINPINLPMLPPKSSVSNILQNLNLELLSTLRIIPETFEVALLPEVRLSI
jgi:hypothetical protein